MAEGIRIRPKAHMLPPESAHGRLVVVRDTARPFDPPHATCATCGVPHDCKTYHFQLDGDGTVIVSTTIWSKLQGMVDTAGFEQANIVKRPPAQGIVVPPARVTIRPAEM